VTREVDVPDGNGLMELVVTSLPPQTVNTSLYSEGSDGVRILSTRFRNRPVKADTREEVQKLEAQQRELAHAAQKMQGDTDTLKLNVAMLASSKTSRVSRLRRGLIRGSSTATRSSPVRLRDEAAGREEQGSDHDPAATRAEQGAGRLRETATPGVDGRHEQDGARGGHRRGQKNGGPSKVRLNYLVDSASWRPQYKFRAGKDEKEQVQIEYLAGIVQQTGEDWGNCNVTLSTAQPLMNSSPPELRALDVAVMPRDQVAKQPPGTPGMNLKDQFRQGPGAAPAVGPGVQPEEDARRRQTRQRRRGAGADQRDPLDLAR